MRAETVEPARAVNLRVSLVYILAASHSGSTLLAMLLGAHPDICTVGELKITSLGDPENYRCSCQRLIRQCPFWTAVQNDMRQRGHDFDIAHAGTDLIGGSRGVARRLLAPLHRGPWFERLRDSALALVPCWRNHLEHVQALNAHLMQRILERTGKKHVVDSSKIGIRLKYLLRNPLLDVRVVRLVRDGRGVSLTYIDPARFADARDPRLRGGGMGGDREMERLSMTQAAHEWRRSNEEAESIMRQLDPARCLEVRYEELCAEPAHTLARVHRFLGVTPATAVPDFRQREHHVIGNGMRLDLTNEVRLDERWRSELSRSQLAEFEAEAGDLNRRLGYL
ncbi:MAG: sulfotransferase [Gammaproteobacteria bacterium]|nr:sulfotransferase [Gammaproteobacteria bacterium]